MSKLTIYCDGACSGNPGIGGWAFIIPHLRHEESDYELDTTNNRMEIKACIEALNYVYQYTSFN
jgi:ribonuclease HI